jgi:hypothetical protein
MHPAILPSLSRARIVHRDEPRFSAPVRTTLNSSLLEGADSPARFGARGFSSVKELRRHARSLFRSPKNDVATGGNAK